MTERVEELIAHLKSLTDEELQELSTTPEFGLLMHKVYRIRPGEPLTLERIEMDAQICRQYPCSTEYYKAQMELSRQRFKHSRSRRGSFSPTARPPFTDRVLDLNAAGHYRPHIRSQVLLRADHLTLKSEGVPSVSGKRRLLGHRV